MAKRMRAEVTTTDISAASAAYKHWFQARIETMSEESRGCGERIGFYFDLAMNGPMRDVRDRRAFKKTIKAFEEARSRS